MNLNFDFRNFQKESMEQLAKIYAEAMIDQEIMEDYSSTYEKMQKILKCEEMSKCHPYLFTIDRQYINETDRKKIDELFECGVKRGFLSEDETEEITNNQVDCDDTTEDDVLCGGPSDTLTGQGMETTPVPEVNQNPTFTVLYSAMKNGDVKMGEFYSLKDNEKTAKQDCIEQMTEAGYGNITIMAIEQNVDAINTNIEETPIKDLYESLYEDDSEEYEKQETGNISDTNSDGGSDSSDNPVNTEDSESNDTSNSSTEEPEENSEMGDNKSTEDIEIDDNKEDEPSETSKDSKKELTAAEKTALKDEYTKFFKDVLNRSEIEKSVSEMTLEEKISFLQKISEKWKKNDPSDFLTHSDEEKLNQYVPIKDEDDTK